MSNPPTAPRGTAGAGSRRRSVAPLVALALTLGACTAPSAAQAIQCEVGFRPGATLLFPYFEVDTSTLDGITTLISINNSAETLVLTRVVLWTDFGEPALSFDLLLRPNDVQTLNLRDVIAGTLPRSSGPDLLAFTGCNEQPPGSPPRWPAVSPGARGMQDKSPLLSWPCGYHHADGRARGYVTVDTINRCRGTNVGPGYYVRYDTPADGAYYSALTLQNVLWGDLLYVDPAGNSAQGVEAVSVQADESINYGTYKNSFYGRFINWDGRDKRSPLPTRWLTRFLNGGAFSGGTDLIVFRDLHLSVWTWSCTQTPAWYPLLASSLTAHDEDGKRLLGFRDHGLFGLATQRVPVSVLAVSGLTAPFGRLDLDLSRPGSRPAGAWVIPVMTASNRFSLSFNAQPTVTGCGQTPRP